MIYFIVYLQRDVLRSTGIAHQQFEVGRLVRDASSVSSIFHDVSAQIRHRHSKVEIHRTVLRISANSQL